MPENGNDRVAIWMVIDAPNRVFYYTTADAFQAGAGCG
jgi:hypothetical protein